MKNTQSLNVPDPHPCVFTEDWENSPNKAFLEPFEKSSQILKIRGDKNRSDLLYLSDLPGYLTLYRWDPEKKEGKKIIPDDEPIADCQHIGDFVLHPFKPVVVYTRDQKGDQNHTIFQLNYETGELKTVTHSAGCIAFMASYGEDSIIAGSAGQSGNRIIRIDFSGKIVELFHTEQQILGVKVSNDFKMAVAAVGRDQTRIIVIDIPTRKVKHQFSESEFSSERYTAIDEDSGYLAYSSIQEGGQEEIVIRSLETFKEIKRVRVPGSIGYYVLDLDYIQWLDKNTLIVSVAKDGKCFPFSVDLTRDVWSDPLSLSSSSFLTHTKEGVFWVASDFTKTGYVEMITEDTVKTLIPPSYETKNTVVIGMWYSSFDELLVHGWLKLNRENKKAPLIVWCHGGPTYAEVNEWSLYFQAFVQAGYHVFIPNFRGSTSYGKEFLDLNIGDFGGGDLKDVLAGAKYVSNHLELDSKPFILGGSYGGYLTLQALTTQIDEWAGGVAIVPVTDFNESYGVANANYRQFFQHFFKGTPKKQPALYKDRSPITHLEKLQEGVLIIAGKNDPSCPYAPIKSFYEKGRAMKKNIHLITEDAGHGSSTAKALQQQIVHSLDFLSYLQRL